MSEYVLAALVKCPLTPVSPSGPPTASSGVSSTDPHLSSATRLRHLRMNMIHPT